MHFETREDYIMWATVMVLQNMNLMTDTNAHTNAIAHAQALADRFFGPAPMADRRTPFNERPEIRPPPGPNVIAPAVPGQRATVNPQ